MFGDGVFDFFTVPRGITVSIPVDICLNKGDEVVECDLIIFS